LCGFCVGLLGQIIQRNVTLFGLVVMSVVMMVTMIMMIMMIVITKLIMRRVRIE
jgi:hypothetical protein